MATRSKKSTAPKKKVEPAKNETTVSANGDELNKVDTPTENNSNPIDPNAGHPQGGGHSPVETPAVIDTTGMGPGTGIDTDGDGNANYVVGGKAETTEPEIKPEKFSYKGKVRLSDQHYDAVDTKRALKLVSESGINQHYKDTLTWQINKDKITPEYANMLRRIIEADSKGSIYSGTLEG